MQNKFPLNLSSTITSWMVWVRFAAGTREFSPKHLDPASYSMGSMDSFPEERV